MSIKEANILMEEVLVFENFNEKRKALNNLILVCKDNELVRNEELYQRFISDYTKLEHDYQNYWQKIAEKYDIHEDDGYYLHLDFKSRIVTLRKEQ